MAQRNLSWSEALEMLLRGECVPARRMQVGAVAYLRRQAWQRGYTLQDSGVFEYRTYSFAKN